MAVRTIGPHEAASLMAGGAVLVDIREADQYAREHIRGGVNLALSKLAAADLARHRGRAVIFTVAPARARAAMWLTLPPRSMIAARFACSRTGWTPWRKAGLPTVVDRRQPIELQRQGQIGAGGLTLVGTILGLLLSPWFFAVPLFVGAGLLFAGLSGFCGMAVLLQHAPWNRTAAAGDQTQKAA